MKDRAAIIVGAGPAGLTAAYELLEKTDVKPIIFEKTNYIGGISRTVDYKGNMIDIGGHRFFSKSDRVMDFWQNIFSLESRQGRSGQQENDKVLLVRKRLSRIFFLRRFFDYPISLTIQTVSHLGIWRTFKIGASAIKAKLFPIREETSLEDFLINRFGRVLYETFFRDYTKKVWGVPCNRIPSEWGTQRIKGLSISRAILHAVKSIILRDSSIGQKSVETSLINQFLYPKFGPGQLWEEVARIIESKGGEIHLQHDVTGFDLGDNGITEARVKNLLTGETRNLEGDFFISTMPVKDLIRGLSPSVPSDVCEVAEGLVYRDFITVGLLLKKLKIKNQTNIKTLNNIIPDNWIYIQERDVKLGRLQIFNNWSPYMVKDPNTVWVGLEYFCDEDDALWSKGDDEFIELATNELAEIGIIEKSDVLDSVIIRMPKTYPAYFGTYGKFDVIREYTDRLENLFLIGRNGMHRYNNQDHSMLTAMAAAENIAKDIKTKDNIWQVNAEQEYHESKITAIENLTEAYIKRTNEKQFEYNPDVYWEDTGISYPYYPTVRHRKRFIIDAIRRYQGKLDNVFVFDYGCGEGEVLEAISDVFRLPETHLGGCDISATAIEEAKKRVDSPYIYNDIFPELDKRCDIIVCSEVLEHTKDYLDILHWIKTNLAENGLLILTTQAGRIHTSDRYTGHTQHFDINELNSLLTQMGFSIERSSLWGFPFFTLQKYLTNINFESTKNNYLEGGLTTRKKIVFSTAYFLYFIHDFVKYGPQIYITASKVSGGSNKS